MLAATCGLTLAALLLWPVSAGRSTAPSVFGRGRPRQSAPVTLIVSWLASLTQGSPVVVRLCAAGLGILCGVVGGATVSLPFGIVVGVAAPLMALAAASAVATRRERADLRQDCAAIGGLAAELRAGQPMAAALRSASPAASRRSAQAFRSAATAVDIGADPVEVLLQSTDSAGGPGASARRLVAVTWRLSRSVGCPLADGMESVERDLRERLRHAEHITSLLAGPKASSGLLAALPIFGLLMGGAVGADPWVVLTSTGIGGGLLLAGAALSLLGLTWTRALVRRAERSI